MNEDLANIFLEASKHNSYFITATIRDKTVDEGDLKHYTIRNDFPVDDIIHALDESVRSLKVKNSPAIEVKRAPLISKNKKPLKIAIISHFNRAPSYYSPARAVRHQIKMLKEFGHEVVFFVQEGSTLDWDCEMRPVVTRFKREKNVVDEVAKNKFIEVLKKELVGFDIVITHDLFIDDCITYREAIKECGVNIEWLHWARSGVGFPIDFDMPNARYVYMNYADTAEFASMIGVNHNKVRVVFNEKDPSNLFNWSPITINISNVMRLWDKNIIQSYPLCTTRFDAKGGDLVIKTFGMLKSLGKKVALIFCNANGHKRLNDIESKLKLAKEYGLINGEDIMFTSLLANDTDMPIKKSVPHEVVANLFQVSNLFIFPTMAEVCSNVLLEASMAKNLLVINRDLPSLSDFVDSNAVLYHNFTSFKNMHYQGRDDETLKRLAVAIVDRLDKNDADKQFRHVWKTHNTKQIYYGMLEPLLYEKIK